MSQLVIKPKSDICKTPNQNSLDIFSDYGLDTVLLDYMEEERISIAKKILRDSVFMVSIGLNSLNELKVIIPPEFISDLKSGAAHLGRSHSALGQMSPGIYNSDNELIGQVRIGEGVNADALAGSLMNIAMYSTLSSISSQIDDLIDKVDEILKEIQISRKAEVLGCMKTFMNGWPYVSENDKRKEADNVIRAINSRIAELQQEIEGNNNELCRGLGFWRGFLNGLGGRLFRLKYKERNEKNYAEIMYRFSLYFQYMRYVDILQAIKGEDAEHISNNHFSDINFANRVLKNTPRIIKEKLGTDEAKKLDYAKKLVLEIPQQIKNSKQKSLEINYTQKEFKSLN